MKFCVHLPLLLSNKIMVEWELDNHRNRLKIILEIHSSTNVKARRVAITWPQLLIATLFRLQGLPMQCRGAFTCLSFLKEPSKPEQLLPQSALH